MEQRETGRDKTQLVKSPSHQEVPHCASSMMLAAAVVVHQPVYNAKTSVLEQWLLLPVLPVKY